MIFVGDASPKRYSCINAGVAELVDAQRLGRCSQRSVGSSPAARTNHADEFRGLDCLTKR